MLSSPPLLNNKLEPVWLWNLDPTNYLSSYINRQAAASCPLSATIIQWDGSFMTFILIDYLSSDIKRYLAASCPLHPPHLHSDLEPIWLGIFILLITLRATLQHMRVLHVLSLSSTIAMSWKRYGSGTLSYWLPFELHYKTRGCFMPLPCPTFTQWAGTGIALNMLLYDILKIILTENYINVSRVFL